MASEAAGSRRHRLRRIAVAAGGVLLGILLVAGLAVFILTQTDFGRERVRRFTVNALNERANGAVSIGEASGNLLTGITLADFAIVDSTGAPLVRADTISARYSLRGLLSSRIVLEDVRLVRPDVVLDRRPGQDWNFVRIFPTDTAAKAPGKQGIGSWILLNDVTIRDGHVRIRNAWAPPDTLPPAVREARIARALEGDSRLYIEAVPGGYQSVMDLRALDAWLPRLRLADPDSTDILVAVDSLRTRADIFRPRTAEVRQLAGVFRFGEDSIRFADARLRLPATEVSAEGAYALADGGLRVAATSPALAFQDVLWLVPELPAEGGGSFTADVRRDEDGLTIDAEALDFAIGDARIAGRLGMTLGDTVLLRDTNLRVASLDTRLIERFVPSLDLARHGTVDGTVVLAGSPAALQLDADLAFTEPRSGRSAVRAEGTVGTGDVLRLRDLRVSVDPLRMDLLQAFVPAVPGRGSVTGNARLDGAYPGRIDVDGDLVLQDPASGRSRVSMDGGLEVGAGFAFRSFALAFDPLQVGLARTFAPDLPLGGVVHGNAVLNGTLDRLAARGDVVHTQDGERSHVVGSATIAGGAYEADLRLLPVSLATVGRFAPAAQLHGTASGDVRIAGTAREVRANGDLAVPNDGAIRFDAWLDHVASRYDVSAALRTFDAAAVTALAPATSLTGIAAARGTGFDPATMNAEVRAELTGPVVDLATAEDGNGNGDPPSIRVDSLFLDADIAAGLLDVERARVRLASADLTAQGMFGLVDGRTGTLTYALRVDSLADFAGYVPPDTLPPRPPRPGIQAAAIARARADSLRFARATEVERMATGQPALPALDPDTAVALPRDSLSGALHADGTLRGGVGGFDLSGTAVLERVIAYGNAVRAGTVTYDARAALTPAATYDVVADLDSVYVAGFAFRRVDADVYYRGDFEAGDPGGRVDVSAVQDSLRDYRVAADFVLALDQKLVRVNELGLRFDTTTWTAARPSSIAWGGRGLTVDDLELVNGAGGRVAADGTLPTEGAASLDVAVRDVQIADVSRLLQTKPPATGLLTLDAQLRGTATAPRLTSTFQLVAGQLGERPLPDIRGRAGYDDARATASATLTADGRTLLDAQGYAPVRLSLAPFAFERLDGPLEVLAHADSLPLDALPAFTPAVRDVQGRVDGDFALRGTWEEPALAGRVDLVRGAFHVVPLGVTFTDAAGSITLAEARATIDSLVAHSHGTVRVDGVIDLAALDSPTFDLRVDADDARVLDNERGSIRVDAAIDVAGPLDRVEVGGQVDVQSGVIYIPEPEKRLTPLDDPAVAHVADTADAATRELLPARNPLLDNLRVDITVNVARDTWVRNTDANVEIYTPADAGALRVVLDQAAGEVGLIGALNTDRGEYNAFGRRFTLTRGGVTFQGGRVIDPLLHVIAVHEVRLPGRESFDIRVHVGGVLSAPTLSLESDAQPPISQTDLLSYLAFGASSTSLLQQGGSSLSGQSSSGGSLAGGVAALATRQLAGIALDGVIDELESDAARQVGVDVFRITPADLPPELSFGGFENVLLGTEVEVGKYFARRWFVAGQARPTLVRPGARVEYVTPRGFRWSLSYEPRFLPRDPSFDPAAGEARTTGALGMFLRWVRRY
jgi:translocation and assembly module TamB